MLQHHMPLGLAEIIDGCNSGAANPFDAGGMGCGVFHSLQYLISRKLLLQEACDYWRTSTFTDFKKCPAFLDIIAKRKASRQACNIL